MMHCWACQAQGERSVSPPRRRAKPGQRSERKSCRRTSSGSPVFSSLGIVFSSDTNTVARASRIENASSQRKGQSWRGKKKKKKLKTAEIPEKFTHRHVPSFASWSHHRSHAQQPTRLSHPIQHSRRPPIHQPPLWFPPIPYNKHRHAVPSRRRSPSHSNSPRRRDTRRVRPLRCRGRRGGEIRHRRRGRH